MKNIIYEDDVAIATIPENPAVVGHIRVYPKKEYKKVEDIPPEEYSHIWYVASFSATLLFEGLQAQGTNIIMNEMNEKFVIDVVARSENDGLDFNFSPIQIDEASLDGYASKIKDKADLIGHSKPKKEAVDMDKKEEIKAKTDDSEEENYLVKSLDRLP